MRLQVQRGRYAVARLPPDAPQPRWPAGAFVSITRTPSELSVVCDDDAVPDDLLVERGWSCISVEGPIPFDAVGVAASLIAPLAADGISVFLISTYDTDYVLVREADFERACDALIRAGHELS